jgi:hypothetical protein
MSELTILGEKSTSYPVELLSHSGAHCVVASRRTIPTGAVARIRTAQGVLLGEVVSCVSRSQVYEVAFRSLNGLPDPPASSPDRPISVLQDLLSLNAHLMACEA